ncbi:MAG TPA: magnesium transporter CorA family protein [Rubrivivax sp.]|nr:magnesium transporter CorA family protein [Rubrivivax sp.]
MHAHLVGSERFEEVGTWPEALPDGCFLWLGCERQAFEAELARVQAALVRWTGFTLFELHVSDLLNAQLPSHFDYTSGYELMVFRRLAAGPGASQLAVDDGPDSSASARLALQSIDTSPVGFAVFDRVLLTVHPADCAVREHFSQRLQGLAVGGEARNSSRLPGQPADLMLRMVNHMVDSYLDLRRLLTRQLTHLQQQLLDPRSRFDDWQVLLDSRNALHLLEDTCEDQRSAVQEWIDALEEWPAPTDKAQSRERELLRLRSRDVQEHIERVLTHVRRLEHSAETAVQMHFSALGHRTNDIMRTLTVLTAVFLPLNLITGFFGMNFDAMPLIHSSTGLWFALGAMLLVGAALLTLFWRKRYLGTRRR